MARAVRCACVCMVFLKVTPARITRAVSKNSATMQNVSSQQEVAGLLSASQLSLNVSLTNRALACTALLTTQLHFQLLFFNFFPPLPFFFCSAQRLSVAKKTADTQTILKQIHALLVEDALRVEVEMCRGEHRVSVHYLRQHMPWDFFRSQWHMCTGLVQHSAQYAAAYQDSWTQQLCT